jgi:hypothetical protein
MASPEAQLNLLRGLLPSFALALKCVSLGRVAETLVETYLGRDAGRRVLSGRIGRGVAERIGAVIGYGDLRGFTRISEGAAPDDLPWDNIHHLEGRLRPPFPLANRAHRRLPPFAGFHEGVFGRSKKNRTISRLASGPLGSVYDPAALPPDQA